MEAQNALFNNNYIYGLPTDIMSVIANNKKLEQYTLNGLNLSINSSSGIYSISSNNALITDYNYDNINLKLSITSTSSADALGSSGITVLNKKNTLSNFKK